MTRKYHANPRITRVLRSCFSNIKLSHFGDDLFLIADGEKIPRRQKT
jgi:hypothetical protein